MRKVKLYKDKENVPIRIECQTRNDGVVIYVVDESGDRQVAGAILRIDEHGIMLAPHFSLDLGIETDIYGFVKVRKDS